MTDMIEKIARAMWEAEKGDGLPWELKLPTNKARWIARAKAALTALEQPSDEMSNRAAAALFEEHGYVSGPMLLEYYSAMIKAARGDQ